MKSIWITWEKQRRNTSMSASVGAQLFELISTKKGLSRHIALALRTVRLVLIEKPSVIYFQNPSIILSTLIVLLRLSRITSAKIVGDLHNAGVFPPKGQSLCRWIARNSTCVIVTNEGLASKVRDWGASVLSIPDPLPNIQPAPTINKTSTDGYKVLFICSWADDEPISEVIEAATHLRSGIHILITGRPKLSKFWNQELPNNVTLTGFLSEDQFEHALASSDIIMDLTTREDCMVCGAYEAVAVEKPVILSNNKPTMEYFYGSLFTDNSAKNIASCINHMTCTYDEHMQAARLLKNRILETQSKALQPLKLL